MLGIKRKNTTRKLIIAASAFSLLLGSLAAFGSLAKIGKSVQEQSTIQANLEKESENYELKVKAESEKSKAHQKYGLGEQTDQFILIGLTQDNFFTATEKFSQSIQNFKNPERKLNLLDQHRNIIGSFDGKEVCNLKQICKKLN
jgi:hypothetical protein